MLLQLFTIARNAFVESVRQPVLLLLVLLSGIFQVFNTWNTGFAMAQDESGKVTGDNKLLLDIGLGTIFVLGTLLAGFIATAVLSREIENKTVLTVVSKPVSRHTLVLGKYLGVAGAITGAVVVMLIFLLLGLRHGVLSTSGDELDGPVLVFGLLSVAISLLVAAWCNFFYGWNFTQIAVSLLVPLAVISYILVLKLNKKWHLQPLETDLSSQVLFASATLTMAILVLASVALAASTRLGQVMTIVVCCGVFLLALLSNHLIGKHVFTNKPLGMVQAVAKADESKGFNEPGQISVIILQQPTNEPALPKQSFFYSPSPSGFPMLNSDIIPFRGDLKEINDIMGPASAPGLVVVEADRQVVTVRATGAEAFSMMRQPAPGDYVFLNPTAINKGALVAWVAVPNLQIFWLLDAVTQNRDIPFVYVLMVGAYAMAQIGVFLSLGVILFQRRDVG